MKEPQKKSNKAIINRVRAAVNKEMGNGNDVFLAKDAPGNCYHIRRPTSIMGLDIDLGGGFPAGTINKISGKENVGKTTILYLTFAMNQRIYGEDSIVGLGVTEYMPDYWSMRKAGFVVAVPEPLIEAEEKSRIKKGLPKFTKEENEALRTTIGEFALIPQSSGGGEAFLGTLLNLVGTNGFQILGVDSMSMVSPEAELLKDLDESQKRAARALLVTNFTNKLHSRLMKNNEGELNQTTFIEIDQVRSNPDKATAGPRAAYMPDYKPVDAFAGRHASACTLILSNGEKIRSTKSANKGEILGKDMDWLISKGKLGTHDNIRGSTPFYYDKFIDIAQTVVAYGASCGLIREVDNEVHVVDSAGKLLATAPSSEALKEMLRTDIDLDLRVREEILYAHKINCQYR